jgi:plastocyanin
MKRRQFVTSVLAGGLSVPAFAAQNHDHGEQVDGPLANVNVSFGQWKTAPALDRLLAAPPNSANLHKLIPFEATVKAGGTVNFIISGFHLVAVYGPGTEFEDINGSLTVALPGAMPTFPRAVDDPVNRIYRGLNPLGAPPDRVEAVNFATPGRYVAICAFLPHFTDRMHGFIRVLP